MCNCRHLVVLLSVKKTVEHGYGKHMPDCGVTGNETNENKHEKSNRVTNFFY